MRCISVRFRTDMYNRYLGRIGKTRTCVKDSGREDAVPLRSLIKPVRGRIISELGAIAPAGRFTNLSASYSRFIFA